MGAYAASKHALEGASDALRREVSPFGVEVVVLGATGMDGRGEGRGRSSRFVALFYTLSLTPFSASLTELGAVTTPIWAKADALDPVARYAGTAWESSLRVFMRLMGAEGKAGYPARDVGALIANVVQKAGRAPSGGSGGAAVSSLFWALTTRPAPRLELIPSKWMVWTAPRLLPDRVTDWAVRGLFGIGRA
jgi:NAD(P)-dependent dehydrogenase (short-subunit alcohol dehydrogenase family)